MFPHSAVRELWWLALAGGGAAARYVQLRKRRRIRPDVGDQTLPSFLVDEQQQHGYNAHSLVSIAPDAHFWYCPELDGSVVYNEVGKVWLVPGDPIAKKDDLAELTRRFMDAARKEAKLVAFMPATERFAESVSGLGLDAVKVGAAPYFDLRTWGPRGDRAKKARAGVNQARRAGVRVGVVDEPSRSFRDETTQLCEAWLKSRRFGLKLGWLFNLDPFQHAHLKKYFAARDATGRLVGFLEASPMPARHGWYLEDVIRAPDAPVGTNDLLVVEALNSLKLGGALLATLGTSPLAHEGVISSRVENQELTSMLIRGAFRCLAPFYNFDGLRRFKSKFAPTWWESEYLLFPRQLTAPPYILKAFIQAIAPRGASKQLIQQVTDKLRLQSFQRKVRTSARKVELVRTELGMIEDGFKHCPDRREQLPASQSGNHYLSQFVTVEGLRLHYVNKGCGKPVVFIHGNPGSYHDSMAVFQDVSESHRTIVFDRPGHGYSERRDGESMTVEGQARLLLKALQLLNVESPIVVGHSWGGSVALAMSLLPEANLSGLVLLAPAAYPSGSSEWWAHLVEAPLIGRYLVKTLTPLIGKRIVRDSLRVAYSPNEIQPEYLESAAELWLSENRIRALVEDDKSLNASLELMSQSYSELRLPVIILTGVADQVVKPGEHAERLHAAIPGSRLITLPDTGHQIPQLRPEAVREAIELVGSLAETSR